LPVVLAIAGAEADGDAAETADAAVGGCHTDALTA
jgi:hypothetical protein